MLTEHLFPFDAWFKRRENKCSAGTPAILSLDPILRPRIGFFENGSKVIKDSFIRLGYNSIKKIKFDYKVRLGYVRLSELLSVNVG